MAARKAAKVKEDDKGKKKDAPIKPAVSRAAKEVQLAMSDSTGHSVPRLSYEDRSKVIDALVTKSEGRLKRASEFENVYTLRRPTGIIDLDIALGGGFPAGGACMISGIYNAGKTWLLFKTIAMQQQIYGNAFSCALHISETQVPYDQMLQAGMRIAVPDNVIRQWIERDAQLGIAWTAENIQACKMQVGTFHIIPAGTGEQVLQTVLECTKTNAFDIIGVDSINSLEPERNAGKDMEEESARAAQALMMGRFWPKYVPHVNNGYNTTTLLFMQQVRQNDSAYGKDWKVVGCKANEHFKIIDLALWPGKQIRRTINGKDIAIGKETNFETIKGKAGTHDHITGSFNFFYPEFMAGSVDIHGDLILAAMRYGILMRTNVGLQLLNGVTRAPVASMAPMDEQTLRQVLVYNFDFELEVRRHVLAAAGVRCLYR